MGWPDIYMSIGTGFLGSLLVVLFLYSLRPRIEISKEISEQPGESRPSYGFKMINRTHYPIFDVQVIIELITPKSVPGGQIVSTRRLDLPKDKFIIVQKFNKSDMEAKYGRLKVSICGLVCLLATPCLGSMACFSSRILQGAT